MQFSQLLEKIKHHVAHLFSANGRKELLYHNLVHTEQVVANTSTIANHYKLGDKDFFIAMAAAWFHDTGYYTGSVSEHEQNGAKIAEAFLKDNAVEDDITLAVTKCILATTMPQKPVTLLEQILCDADMYHLGTDDFKERNRLMRKEMEKRKGKKIPKDEWRKKTIALMESHQFHTDFCKNALQDTKNKHRQALKLKEAEVAHNDKENAPNSGEAENKNDRAMVSNIKIKNDGMRRGIDTMFKITATNNQRLSDMADNKANIMISTTSIILSILLSVLFRKFEESPQWVFPAILLLSVCVVTMILAILATRPSLPSGRFTQEEVKEKKTNLLFFGNFYRMSLDEYITGMQDIINDNDYVNSSLLKDIYSQGIVLGRKYRLLRVCYNIFMYGIVLSVISFIVVALFFK